MENLNITTGRLEGKQPEYNNGKAGNGIKGVAVGADHGSKLSIT